MVGPTKNPAKESKPKGTASSTTAPPSSASTMESALDNSVKEMKVSMAQKILQDNDPKKTKKDRKKDKKKKKKKSSSSSDDSTGSESGNFLDDLQLQCGLKPKHMNLKDLVRLDDFKPEQLMFLIAFASPLIPNLTVMDLFEAGGELTGLRRKESAKTKKGGDEKSKTLAQQIEHSTEAAWQGRLLRLLKLLSDKDGRATMCNYQTLVSLRKSLTSKVHVRLKTNEALVEKVKRLLEDLKKESIKDLETWNLRLMKRQRLSVQEQLHGKKEKSVEKKECDSDSSSGKGKKRKDRSRKAKSSVSKGKVKNKKKTKKVSSSSSSAPCAGEDDSQAESGDAESHVEEERKPKRPRCDDDDLWSTTRFTPSSHQKSEAEEKPKELSDGLQEMLAHTMCEHFKSPTDISLFQKILASMNVLSPADMLREVQGFVSSTEVPREKLNCTEFLKAWPESDVFYKQLTFQGKMAAANVVKDIAVNLDPKHGGGFPADIRSHPTFLAAQGASRKLHRKSAATQWSS